MATRGSTNSLQSPRLSAWQFVATFGTVSLLADFVYEGARSVTGPLLSSFGATALIVGLVTGVGEAAALLLRLVSGPLSDRTKRFWSWTLAGYALTVIAVPPLGFAGALWVASGLVILERVGKAVRSPAKDALLSYATAVTGRGRGFAVHEALDQVGAVIGPLVVAGMLAITGDQYGPSLAVLAVPGVVAMALLAWLCLRVPQPLDYETSLLSGDRAPSESAAPGQPVPSQTVAGTPAAAASTGHEPLPRRFWLYAAFTALTMIGFATFGVLSFHMVAVGLLSPAAVPVLYAGVMVVDALAALATGWAFDAWGPRVLVALPIVAATVPVLSFSNTIAPVIAGALLWGVALGIQESTLRATVAELVPSDRRGTAYGVFAAIVGVATAAGGTLAGGLYQASLPALIATTTVAQLAAIALLLVTTRRGLRTS